MNEIQGGYGLFHSKQSSPTCKYLRSGFFALQFSSAFGEAYSLITNQTIFGPILFFQGPAVLSTSISGLVQISFTHFLLYLSLALASLAFWSMSNAFAPNRIAAKHRKAIRLAFVFLAVVYIEALTPLILTLVLGTWVENVQLTYSAVNYLVDAVLVLVYIYFVSFVVFLLTGTTLGLFGGAISEFSTFKRSELLLAGLLLFVGVFSYPIGIVAGFVGYWSTIETRFTFSNATRFIMKIANNPIESTRFLREALFAVLGVSMLGLAASIYYSYQIRPLVSIEGIVWGFTSPLLSGSYSYLVFAGLMLCPALIACSIYNLIKTNRKLVAAEWIVILILGSGLLLIWSLMAFDPAAVIPESLTQYGYARFAFEQPIIWLCYGMLIDANLMFILARAKKTKIVDQRMISNH